MRTYAARARKAAWLLLIGLSVSMLPVESGLASVAFGASTTSTTTTTATTTSTSTATTTMATSTTAATPPVSLSLGFSPSALYPVSEGIPVYTVGDTIWVMSGYSSSVTITLTSTTPGSSATTSDAKTTLGTDAVVPLYTFTAKNPDGVWNITLSTSAGPGGQTVIPVHFVNLASHPTSLAPFAYSLEGGSLVISTNASLGDTYDQEVCAAGNDTSAGVTVALPTAMDEAGNVTLSPGNLFGLAVSGTVNEPFSFWVELYHSYSLDIMNTNNLVSVDALAADSQPIPISTTGTTNTTLAWNLPVHEGRYELRAYFQNSTSLDVVQSDILVLSQSSWVSLTSDCPPQALQSSAISYPADLAGGPSTWPVNFYLMYQTFGIEGVDSAPVVANLSSVSFTFNPWNVTSLSVNVSPSAAVTQTSQAGNTLYVLASQYPAKVPYTLDVNGENDIAQGTATLPRSYSALTDEVSLGMLTVYVVSNRDLTSSLNVTGPSGISLSNSAVVANKSASFLVPKGVYSVTGLQGNVSQSAQTNVTDGATDSVTLTFHVLAAPPKAGPPYETIEVVLVAVAAVTIAANIALRVGRSKGLGARMAEAAEPNDTNQGYRGSSASPQAAQEQLSQSKSSNSTSIRRDPRLAFIGLGIALVIVAIYVYHVGSGLVGGGILVQGNTPTIGKGSAYEVLGYVIGFFGVLVAGVAAFTLVRKERS